MICRIESAILLNLAQVVDWERQFSHCFQIERNMIMVTVFLVIVKEIDVNEQKSVGFMNVYIYFYLIRRKNQSVFVLKKQTSVFSDESSTNAVWCSSTMFGAVENWYQFSFPFNLNGTWSYWQFNFNWEPNGTPLGS